MRKLIVSTFLSLDGVMQAPGGPEEDPTGGFELGGWSVNYWDDMMGQHMTAAMSTPFDLLLGRKTYDIFAAHWPRSDEQPVAGILNNATKYVASSTLKEVEWQNSQLLDGDAAKAVAGLKQTDGPEIQVHGSGDLIQTLLGNDLVDEFRLWVFPLILGKGKRLFSDGAIPAGLKLVDSKTSTTGVIIGTFVRAGEIAPGSFALNQPTGEELKRRQSLADA